MCIRDSSESAAASLQLRSFPYVIGDVVRGSVIVDGAGAMIEVIEKLRGNPGDGEGRRFEAWRLKNTHHSGAVVVGGYRDVKVLGRFSAVTVEETLAMIVEIQVVELTFFEVKEHMHKLYAVARGDFS